LSYSPTLLHCSYIGDLIHRSRTALANRPQTVLQCQLDGPFPACSSR